MTKLTLFFYLLAAIALGKSSDSCAKFYSTNSTSGPSSSLSLEVSHLKNALETPLLHDVSVPKLKKGNWVQIIEHITESYENIEYGKILSLQKFDRFYSFDIEVHGQDFTRTATFIVDRNGKDDWHTFTFKRLDDSSPSKLSYFKTLAKTNLPVQLKSAWETASVARLNQGKNHVLKNQPLSELMKNWTKYASRLSISDTLGSKKSPLNLTRKHGGAGGSEVYEVIHNDAVYYFRPNVKTNQNVVRKTWLAYQLSKLFGSDSVPECIWVSVYGRLEDGSIIEAQGTLSRKAVGITKKMDLFELDDSSESVSNAQAYEFMIGNTDLSWHNFSYFKREPKPQIEVFDHGAAFALGLAYQENHFDSNEYFAMTPPRHYTQKFVDTLVATTPTILTQRYYGVLSPAELDSVLFRREILLADILLRFPEMINL